MKKRFLFVLIAFFPYLAGGTPPSDITLPLDESSPNGSTKPPDSQPQSQPAPPDPEEKLPRPRYQVEATLSKDGKSLTGKVVIEFENVTAAPLDHALILLYPNRFEERPDYLSELNQPYHYPGPFDPARMEITEVIAKEKPLSPGEITYEKGAEGERTFCKIPLSLAPGETGRVTLGFHTRIPKRYGRFGRAKGAVVLDGGFYPMLAPLYREGFSPKLPPRPGDFTVTLSAPGHEGAAFINGHGPFDPQKETPLSLSHAPYLSWILLEEFHIRRGTTAQAEEGSGMLPSPEGSARVTYYYSDSLYKDRLKEEDRWKIGPPGLDVDEARDYPGEVMESVLDGLRFLGSLGYEIGGVELRLIEVPMRERVALYAPGAILISDRAMKIFPLQKILKYHKLQILRAVYGFLVEERARAFEREEDLPWVADAFGAYLSDLYHLKGYIKQDFAKEMLKPYSFISEIDRLRWIPQVGFKDAYFHTAYEKDLFRDDVRRFGSDWPYGKFIYGKLRGLFGIDKFAAFGRAYLGGAEAPFRALSEKYYGDSLEWFYRQWMGPHPQVNYKLLRFTSTPLENGTYRNEVVVEKEGDTWVKEPVEILALYKNGEFKVLVWPLEAVSHTFTWESASPLKKVQIDPRENTYEYFEGHPYDLRLDNSHPGNYRVVFDGFAADFSSGGFTFATSMSARRTHDKRHLYFTGLSLGLGLLGGFDNDNDGEVDQVLRLNDFEGLSLGYRRAFGVALDADRLTTSAGISLVGARLGPRLGDQDGDTNADSFLPPAYFGRLTLSTGYSDRHSFLSPWKGTSLGASLSYALGVTEDITPPSLGGAPLPLNDSCAETGGICHSVAFSVAATRLISLDGGRVLGLRASAAALVGNPLGQSFFDAGGSANLKGYPINTIQGRARLLGTVEYRHPVLKNLDVNLLEINRWRGLTAVFWVSGVSISDQEAIFHSSASPDGRSLFGRGSYFADAGFGIRLFGDHMGIDPALLSFDFATPLIGNQLFGGDFPPLQVFVSFGQNF